MNHASPFRAANGGYGRAASIDGPLSSRHSECGTLPISNILADWANMEQTQLGIAFTSTWLGSVCRLIFCRTSYLTSYGESRDDGWIGLYRCLSL